MSGKNGRAVLTAQYAVGSGHGLGERSEGTLHRGHIRRLGRALCSRPKLLRADPMAAEFDPECSFARDRASLAQPRDSS